MTNRAIVDITRGITINPTPAFMAAGIYHNPTLGLISLSDDGTNWITITDKNLGATQVYNDGDALSESNCGKYYQWGNNYGFPRTGSVTTSSAQVDASNYGPYYESEIFIKRSGSPYDRSSVQNDNLWGGVTGTVEAMQGPAPTGFHVPSRDENVSLLNTLAALGIAQTGNSIETYLKMPLADCRYGSSASSGARGMDGRYWSSTAYTSSYAYYLHFDSATVYALGGDRRSDGFSVRCFKNTPVIPDSSWRELYSGTGDSGIFWSPELEIISLSSDGENRITIADKNLGATYVYEDGDQFTEGNCGGYFQRGNNYMFPLKGEVTTSSTQVDATNYGPYYYNNIFITNRGDWSSVRNDNLWGDTTDTLAARQGPCDSGYHVPINDENIALVDTLAALGIDTSNGNCMKIYLKMPFAGRRDNSAAVVLYHGSVAAYWSSTASSVDYAYYLHFYSTGLDSQMDDVRSFGFSIRPFKNDPVIPDSFWTRLY